MTNRINKLGSGWKKLGPSVWEHPKGIRIHTAGLAKFPGAYSSRTWRIEEEHRFMRIMGNKKRAVMAWALNAIQ